MYYTIYYVLYSSEPIVRSFDGWRAYVVLPYCSV